MNDFFACTNRLLRRRTANCIPAAENNQSAIGDTQAQSDSEKRRIGCDGLAQLLARLERHQSLSGRSSTAFGGDGLLRGIYSGSINGNCPLADR